MATRTTIDGVPATVATRASTTSATTLSTAVTRSTRVGPWRSTSVPPHGSSTARGRAWATRAMAAPLGPWVRAIRVTATKRMASVVVKAPVATISQRRASAGWRVIGAEVGATVFIGVCL